MKFSNRTEAGKILAKELEKHPVLLTNSLILAIPRGGVPVSYSVAEELKIPFYLVITKKLSHPNNQEVAIGAIAPDGTYELNKKFEFQGFSKDTINQIRDKALEKVQRRVKKYTQGSQLNIKGKHIIIIDDGIATGFTALVAGKYVKKNGAKTANLAIPVSPLSSINRVEKIFDKVICPQKIDSYSFSVGSFYADFHQNSDEELFEYMEKAEKEGLLYKNFS
ncbi:MAG: phosphoribosyltransferase [Candidatus Lokiarchaeota archaeon]|nr:phosphoribosyltransferase [Candidatus Lokiarchaeota archaeon]MBD3199635.1 phosphoribosyltransferase [Candidatus Lokiarchaeota archaeon]